MNKTIINVKSVVKGIGLDYATRNDNQKFNSLKNQIEQKLNKDIKIEDFIWDIQEQKLSHKEDVVNKQLQNVKLKLV